MNNYWAQQGNDFFLSEVSQQHVKLPVGVYKLNLHPKTAQIYASETIAKFEFPYKIYGMEEAFVNRVEKSYKNTTGNFGVLMNGVKGTGKTVTAQQICNKLNLPVLIVHQAFPQIPSFINEIQQNVIIFFDEYEKMYNRENENETEILTIMDGVLNNEFRKMFLLTTNTMYLNDNMLQRPGRIRYVKTFEDLSVSVITEIVDDKLKHKKFRKACIDFIARLDTITIDIVKSVIEEVNIHKEEPEAFKDVFNIKSITNKVNLYSKDIDGSLTKLEWSNCVIDPVKYTKESIDDTFYVNDSDKGYIKEVIDDNTIVVELYGKDKTPMTLRIERLDTMHKSFTKWTF